MTALVTPQRLLRLQLMPLLMVLPMPLAMLWGSSRVTLLQPGPSI